MKVYRVELMVLDFDGLGERGIADTIENTHYPNHCISPHVQKIESREIGTWSDDHPLNHGDTSASVFRVLFT